MLSRICLQLQTVPVLVVYFALAVCAHVQAWPHLLLVYFFSAPLLPPFILVDRFSTVAAWAVTESSSFFVISLISLSSLLIHVATALAAYSLCVGEDGLAIHSGLKLYDALILCVVLFFKSRIVVSYCCEAAICCCGSCPPLGDLEVV